MNQSTYFRKVNKPCERTDEGQYLILSTASDMVVLNETAFYIWDNADHKTLEEVARQRYSNLIDKEDLSFDELVSDCLETLKLLLKLGLVLED